MSTIERTIRITFEHRVHFTRGVFDASNPVLKQVLATGSTTPAKALVVVDESLALSQPALTGLIEGYFQYHADSLLLVCPPFIIEGGERAKNSSFHVSEIHSRAERHHIDRH